MPESHEFESGIGFHHAQHTERKSALKSDGFDKIIELTKT